ALALRRHLERLGPDLVHAQDRRAALVTATVARHRAPIVATFHGLLDVAAGRWATEGPLHGRSPGVEGRMRLVADAAVLRIVSAVVAPSQAMAGFIGRVLRVPAPRIRTIVNGIAELEQHRPAGPARTFTSVGSFAPLKAMPALIEAFADVARARPQVPLRLRLVGDGEERDRCEELVMTRGVDDRVEFTGYRQDAPAQLRQADAFVLPSVNENMPLALLEAMMTGLACVGSRVGGVPEALAAGSGLLVPPGDHAALVDAMSRLADDPDLAPALGRAAADRARSHFTIERCGADHVTLWRDVLSARSR
ncbi:MAG: hypothetical protein QOG64_21, partial [Acidimicrobiaceae bacterium]|nr:hypothetical protein [Acidimicrobiaceae bacterium]